MTRRYRCMDAGCACDWSREDEKKPACPRCGSVYYLWKNYRDFALPPLGMRGTVGDGAAG